jgi:hypothetical protein
MGFINNYKDNFLPTNHPWDDETQKYTVPNQKRRSLSDLDYSVLHDMLEEMSATYKSMPMCKDKMRLKEKMMACIQEIKKRDEMEEATRKERDDNFEQTPPPASNPVPMGVNPTPIQPVSTPPFMDADDMDMGDDDLDMFEVDDDLDISIDNDDLLDDDLLDDDTPEELPKPNNDTTNLLIAGLIVICVLTIMKK